MCLFYQLLELCVIISYFDCGFVYFFLILSFEALVVLRLYFIFYWEREIFIFSSVFKIFLFSPHSISLWLTEVCFPSRVSRFGFPALLESVSWYLTFWESLGHYLLKYYFWSVQSLFSSETPVKYDKMSVSICWLYPILLFSHLFLSLCASVWHIFFLPFKKSTNYLLSWEFFISVITFPNLTL